MPRDCRVLSRPGWGPPASRGSGGELILLLINLGKPNSPSRSQAGFMDIWKLLAYFQSPPMPLAVGTLSSGCRSGPEERPSPQERGQGPEHSGNVALGGQRVSGGGRSHLGPV